MQSKEKESDSAGYAKISGLVSVLPHAHALFIAKFPLEITKSSGESGQGMACKMVLPVAARIGQPLHPP